MTDETLILLGTGNATVTKCFNTCFAIKTGEEYFLVDTGGGNGIMTQLKKRGSLGINPRDFYEPRTYRSLTGTDLADQNDRNQR